MDRGSSCLGQGQLVRAAEVVGQKLEAVAKQDDSNGALLETASKEFKVAAEAIAKSVLESVEQSLSRLEARVACVEKATGEAITRQRAIARERELEAQQCVERERSEKQLLALWLNGFVMRLPKNSNAQELCSFLDAVDMAMARYALNIAIAAPNTAQERMINARVPNFLVGVVDGAVSRMADALGLASADAASLVCGPALLALTHMSYCEGPMRRAIADADGAAAVVACINVATQPPVLMHACRTLSALALDSHARARIVAAAGIPTLVRLIGEARPPTMAERRNQESECNELPERCADDTSRATEFVQEAALAALTNLSLGSQANRQLAVQAGCFNPAVRCSLFARDGGPVLSAARLIGNLVFRSPSAAARCLEARADRALCAAIEASDLTVDDTIISNCFRALANCAVDDVARAAIAASPAAELCVRALRYTPHINVIRNAADCAAAMAYTSLANKARLAQLGVFDAVCRVVSEFGRSDAYELAVAAVARLATTALSLKANYLAFFNADGIRVFTEFCLRTEFVHLLVACAMPLALVAPTPRQRWEALAEGRYLPFEHVPNATRALQRCLTWKYAREEPPNWLYAAYTSLTMSQKDLNRHCNAGQRDAGPNLQSAELYSADLLFQELQAPVQLDHVIASSTCLRDLNFRLY